MLAANGVISEPYVKGVVHCSGNPVYGHPCAAPIIDITNLTDEPMTILYTSRATGLQLQEANRVTVAPKDKALLTGMLPGNSGGLGGHVSYLAVALGASDDFDLYAFVFFPNGGYGLVPTEGHFQIAPGGAVLQVADAAATCCSPTANVFPLQFAGCAAPKWPWTLVYTAAISKQNRACQRTTPVLPCAALATWALATQP